MEAFWRSSTHWCGISAHFSWFSWQEFSYHNLQCEWKYSWVFSQKKNFLFQNPPWQFVTSNESGIVGESSGVIIDILNEMSRKLNFTFVLHLAQASTSLNTTDEVNTTVRLIKSSFPIIIKISFSDDKGNPPAYNRYPFWSFISSNWRSYSPWGCR